MNTATKAATVGHTPGPWAVIDDGQQVPSVHADYTPDGEICVMSMFDPQSENNGDRMLTRAIANARLIAAAPELLAALKDCEGHLAIWDTRSYACAAPEQHKVIVGLLTAARAAIARARLIAAAPEPEKAAVAGGNES